jgi:hypothetical protein
MAQVKYKPEPGASDETEQFGYDFKGGKPVEVTDPAHLTKFRGNRFFEVSEKAKAEKKDDKPADEGLKAVHVAGGRFVIKKDGETIKEGLNKADSDAFNQLSDADKAEYVK